MTNELENIAHIRNKGTNANKYPTTDIGSFIVLYTGGGGEKHLTRRTAI